MPVTKALWAKCSLMRQPWGEQSLSWDNWEARQASGSENIVLLALSTFCNYWGVKGS